MEERNLTLKSTSSGTKDFKLDGKVAIVTGGASGIGQAIGSLTCAAKLWICG